MAPAKLASPSAYDRSIQESLPRRCSLGTVDSKDQVKPRWRSIAIFCITACRSAHAHAQDAAPVQPQSLLPPTAYVAQLVPEPLPAPEEGDERSSLTLAEVESLAMAANPTLAEAAARVRAARGEQYQVGLAPNPVVGYAASEIGDEGRAGQQGMLVGQEFIRGNKLGLNRAVAAREADRLEQAFAAQQQRVLTDVRIAFYEAFLAQRRHVLAENLQTIGRQAVATAGALIEAQEGRKTDLLLAEIEGQRASIDLAQADSAVRGAWRKLAALSGQNQLEVRPLAADLDSLRWEVDWDETLSGLLQTSPEVAEALAEVDRARAALARARVEPVPDVTVQGTAQYDNATQDTIAGAQVTLPLPLWNRNQGGIAKATAELVAAQRRLDAVERRLQLELADEFQRYETALARVDTIRRQILGRAQQNLDLATQGYQAGELAFLDFLTVQRTYFQVNLEYLDALGQLNESVQLLHGQLLSGSYNQP
jgi:outer membrane protein, heavy metal efflux system